MTKQDLPQSRKPAGTWVQTERAAHEAWANLIAKSPAAARILHLLTARVGDRNAVVMSQKTMGDLLNVSRDTIKRGIALLREDRWIEVRQIGDRGTVNAYVINRNVVWTGPRDGIRYALFSANVVVSDQEQPDRADLDHQPALRQLPTLYPGERQFPAGDGMPPPSQPSFPGLEPDLPSRQSDPEQLDLEDFTGQALPSR